MVRDASLFCSLDPATEKNIYVANNFALDITGHGDISYQHGQIIDVYHVPSLNANPFSISQQTHIGKIVKLWLDRFFVKDIHKDGFIFAKCILDSKARLYKFHDLS